MDSDLEKHCLTNDAELRAVLADGEWHHGIELADKVGWRFGASVERVRKGKDKKPPWRITREQVTVKDHRYRFEGPEETEAAPDDDVE